MITELILFIMAVVLAALEWMHYEDKNGWIDWDNPPM